METVEGSDAIEKVKGNTACLKGIRCPACGQYSHFKVAASALFDVWDHGTGPYVDVEWCQHATCICGACGKQGVVSDFEEGKGFDQCFN